MQFALNEDQVAVRDMAREFAAEKIAPHALRWDEEKHFPVDVMREAAKLGFRTALIPAANRPKHAIEGMEVITVARIGEALERLRG